MSGKEFVSSTDVSREIVHHDIDAELNRITVPKALETDHNVLGSFALAHPSDQTITVYIIEAMQLFYPAFARIGCAMALRTLMPCPTPTGDWTQFEWSKLIITNDHAAFGALGIECQNTLFFDLN